jgi:hypothetical protein
MEAMALRKNTQEKEQMKGTPMSTNVKAHPAYEMDAEEIKYWARRGPKTAAFLLVIPGAAIAAAGVGMLLGQMIPFTIIGLGLGMLLWGLIVALTK